MGKPDVMEHLNTNNFLFFFSFILFLDDEKAHDIAVTWHVTWCDIIGLEHGERT